MNEEMNNGGNIPKVPFYRKSWFVILLIIFIPPAGLVMMWVNKQFSKVARIILTIFLVFYSFTWSILIIPTSSSEAPKPAQTAQSEASSEAKPTAKQEETPKPESNVPKEYKSALRKAKTYSDTMHMSKQAIYDQLISEYGEKFTPEAGQYAIDNLDADYNYNALQKAKTYQDSMSMSPDAIRDQLTSEYGEKFTPEEADYAMSNLPQ
ncbi:MAG: Ltp family lipoprotein [Eubacterium sp.]